jgi:hypothetical protein
MGGDYLEQTRHYFLFINCTIAPLAVSRIVVSLSKGDRQCRQGIAEAAFWWQGWISGL